MGRAERIAALRALLARVQKNAREAQLERAARATEHGPGVPGGLELEPEPATDLELEAAALPPAPALPREAELDWTSLLRDDPGLGPARAEPEVEAAPSPPRAPAATPVEPRLARSPRASRPDEVEERGPPSVLELAIRALAERHEAHDAQELWAGAVDSLRERRSTVPPSGAELGLAERTVAEPKLELAASATAVVAPVEVEPATVIAPAAAAAAIAAAPIPVAPIVEAPAAVAIEGAALEAPGVGSSVVEPARDERVEGFAPPATDANDEARLARLDASFAAAHADLAARPRGRVGAALALAAAVALGAVVFWRLTSSSTSATSAPSGASSSIASAPRVESAPLRPASATATAPRPPPSAARSAPSDSDAKLPTATSLASAPPAISDPRSRGLLWIDSEQPADVYLRGVRVGKSGEYVELPCGMGFVRLAAPGSVPAGESFPAWRGEGKAVFVPCGEAHRTRL